MAIFSRRITRLLIVCAVTCLMFAGEFYPALAIFTVVDHGSSSTTQQTPSSTSTIAFILNGTLEVINADGSNRRQLANHVDIASRFSPDGHYLAFTTIQQDGSVQLQVITIDESTQQTVVTFAASDIAQVR